jgi:hypothetical protein
MGPQSIPLILNLVLPVPTAGAMDQNVGEPGPLRL